MKEMMSAYRHITKGGSSYSATVKFVYEAEKRWQMALISYARKHCAEKYVRIAEYQQLNIIMRGLIFKQIGFKRAFKDYCLLKYKVSVFFVGIKRLVKKNILHKTMYT